MPDEAARLFIGIEPDEDTRRVLYEWVSELAKSLGGRFYAPDLYHVTLCFLGQVARERIAALTELMRACAGEEFMLSLDALGAFKQGSILYAGVQDCPALFRLQERLAQALRAEGFALEDAPYVPHITLARHGSGYQEPLPAPKSSFAVRQITLFESTRVEGRLCYLPLHRVPLGWK